MKRNTDEHTTTHPEDYENRTSKRYQPKHRHIEKVNFAVVNDPEFRADLKAKELDLQKASTAYEQSAHRTFRVLEKDLPDHNIRFPPENTYHYHPKGNNAVNAAVHILTQSFRLDLIKRLNSPQDPHRDNDIERLKGELAMTAQLQWVNDQSALTSEHLDYSQPPLDLEDATKTLKHTTSEYTSTAARANNGPHGFRSYPSTNPAECALGAAQSSLQIEVASLRTKGEYPQEIDRALECRDIIQVMLKYTLDCRTIANQSAEYQKDQDMNSDSAARLGDLASEVCDQIEKTNPRVSQQLVNALIDGPIGEEWKHTHLAKNDDVTGADWVSENDDAPAQLIYNDFHNHFLQPNSPEGYPPGPNPDRSETADHIARAMTHQLHRDIRAFTLIEPNGEAPSFQTVGAHLEHNLDEQTKVLAEALKRGDQPAYTTAMTNIKDVYNDLYDLRRLNLDAYPLIQFLDRDHPDLAEELAHATQDRDPQDSHSWLDPKQQSHDNAQLIFESFQKVYLDMSPALAAQAAEDLSSAMTYHERQKAFHLSPQLCHQPESTYQKLSELTTALANALADYRGNDDDPHKADYFRTLEQIAEISNPQ